MIAATALLTGNDATPALAAEAVQAAMTRAACGQASEIILFLSPEFSRQIAPTLTAVSRATGCLQVFGSIAAGVATEEAWAIDRPAVAALVLADLPPPPDDTTDQTLAGAPVFSLCGRSRLPAEWLPAADGSPAGEARFGLLYNDALSLRDTPVWQGARLAAEHHASLRFPGFDTALGLSTGLGAGSEMIPVEAAEGHELIRLAGTSALESLRHALPPSLRQHRPLPVHCVCASVRDPDDESPHPVAVLSANADGTVTLAEPVGSGSLLAWSLRLPSHAEAEMKAMLAELGPRCPAPSFGLFLSCIGRGPFFYAGEDRDWALFRQAFPGVPFIGAYGSGQIFSADHQQTLLQNSVITALFTA